MFILQLTTFHERQQLINSAEGAAILSTLHSLYPCTRTALGCFQHILHASHVQSFKDWEAYYLKSGHARERLLISAQLESEIQTLNQTYGRTIEELEAIAVEMATFHPAESVEACFQALYSFCIDEPWKVFQETHAHEVMLRTWLKSHYEHLTLVRPDYNHHIVHAIDFEVWHQQHCIFAIHCSPIHIPDTQKRSQLLAIRDQKHIRYRAGKQAQVLTLLYDESGVLIDINVLSQALYRYFTPTLSGLGY